MYGIVTTYNMCVPVSSRICEMSETHESLDKPKEEVSGEVETLQGCEAVPVNVKENSLYITLSCRAFYLPLFISPFLWKE